MSGNAADSIFPVCRSETVPRGLSVTVKRESWLVSVRPMPIGGLNVSSEIDVRHSLTYGRDIHGGTSEMSTGGQSGLASAALQQFPENTLHSSELSYTQ